MIDRHALAREMWNELRDCPEPDGRHTMFADIAMRHIEAARAEALEEAINEAEKYSRSAGRAIRALIPAAAPDADGVQRAEVALVEAKCRYPHADDALTFLYAALGHATAAPDADDIAWAHEQIARIESAASDADGGGK